MFSLDEVEQALPPQLKGGLTQDIVDNLNKVISDPEFAGLAKDNMITFVDVLKEGKFKLPDYISAVIYVSYKLMGYPDKECFQKTFPDRYQALVARGCDSRTIAAHVSAYNKGKLVNLVYERSLIPSWVLNQDVYQKAINVQYELMTTAQSEKVRTDAANSILTHLKPPETKKMQLDIGLSKSDDMNALFQHMNDLALRQQKLIELGVPTRDIAHEKIIEDAEVVQYDTP